MTSRQSTARLAELNKLAEDPNLWNDPQKAQKLMQERTSLEDALQGIGKVERELDDNVGMIELGEAENDEGVVAEAENALKNLKKEVARRELEALLSGEADRFDSYLEVHAGAGGTESQDWAADAAAHVYALGREARLQDRISRRNPGRRSRHQIRHHPDHRATTPMAG